MLQKAPAYIEDMQTLYYADVRSHTAWLKKYMQPVPELLVVVYWPADKSYCLLGTDIHFSNWENYSNYSFRELKPTLELPDTIFRIPGDFQWIKVE